MNAEAPSWLLTDGVISIRPPTPGDTVALISGRDEESRRWIGPGTNDPRPTACIVVDDTVVGWVDYDRDQDWLEAGQVNMGYNVFPPYRCKGYASRAVLLLLQRLGHEGQYEKGILSIDRGNHASLGVATKAGFSIVEELPDVLRFAHPIRPDTEEDEQR